MSRYDWMEHAACINIPIDPQHDPFFPPKHSKGHEAKKVCADCAVVVECADYALANNIGYGVWGALTAKDRENIRRGRTTVELVWARWEAQRRREEGVCSLPGCRRRRVERGVCREHWEDEGSW